MRKKYSFRVEIFLLPANDSSDFAWNSVGTPDLGQKPLSLRIKYQME
jgi:hypothetical protein